MVLRPTYLGFVGAYENASTEKSSTGGWNNQVRKNQVRMAGMENASTEKASTNVRRRKVQVRKNEVRLSWSGKCKYKQCR